MIDLDSIQARIKEGAEIETVLKSFDWKGFEKIIAQILKENGFKVKNNYRFKTEKRYEIDVLAEKNGIVLSIDCKDWSRGRYKKSALAKAAKKQSERTKELEKTKSDHTSMFPLIVTLFEEDIKRENDVIVIPVWKLNSFLNNELFEIAN